MNFPLFRSPAARYDLVLTDIDDTLFDFPRAEVRAFRKTLSGLGWTGNKGDAFRLYDEINRRLWAELETGQAANGGIKTERFRRLFAALGAELPADRAGDDFLRYLGEGAYPLPGARALCRRLALGTALAAVTNGMAGVQRSRLARSSLGKFLAFAVISEEAGVAKPDPAIFDRALVLAGNPPRSRVLMVGDSLSSDIRGGSDSGLDTCWYNPEGRELPSGPVPTYQIRRLADLVRIVFPG